MNPNMCCHVIEVRQSKEQNYMLHSVYLTQAEAEEGLKNVCKDSYSQAIISRYIFGKERCYVIDGYKVQREPTWIKEI